MDFCAGGGPDARGQGREGGVVFGARARAEVDGAGVVAREVDELRIPVSMCLGKNVSGAVEVRLCLILVMRDRTDS